MGVSKSVQVLFKVIEAVMVLIFRHHTPYIVYTYFENSEIAGPVELDLQVATCQPASSLAGLQRAWPLWEGAGPALGRLFLGCC